MNPLYISLFMSMISVIVGIMLSLVYLYLLWTTIKWLPNIRHKGLFLFISTVIRLLLFIVVGTILAHYAPMALIIMTISFVITRFIVVKTMHKKKEKHG